MPFRKKNQADITKKLVLTNFKSKSNQLHAVSRAQQGRQKDPSVKTLRSPLFAEFWRQCVLSGRTQPPTLCLNTSAKTWKYKYFISSSGDRTQNQSILQFQFVPQRHNWPLLIIFLLQITKIFLLKTTSSCHTSWTLLIPYGGRAAFNFIASQCEFHYEISSVSALHTIGIFTRILYVLLWIFIILAIRSRFAMDGRMYVCNLIFFLHRIDCFQIEIFCKEIFYMFLICLMPC